MALPKIDLPQYDITLPITGKKLRYRPFVVKEEKILLIALQEENPAAVVTAIDQIIRGCTFDVCNMDNLPQVDIEYLFLNIRNKSMGEGVDVTAKCSHCQHSNLMTLDLSQIKVEQPVKVPPEVQLADDLWVVLKYPSVKTAYGASVEMDDAAAIKVMSSSIETIIHGEQTYTVSESTQEEVTDFIEGLTQTQINKMSKFFEAAPKLVYENFFKCVKCGKQNNIKLEGLHNFFD